MDDRLDRLEDELHRLRQKKRETDDFEEEQRLKERIADIKDAMLDDIIEGENNE